MVAQEKRTARNTAQQERDEISMQAYPNSQLTGATVACTRRCGPPRTVPFVVCTINFCSFVLNTFVFEPEGIMMIGNYITIPFVPIFYFTHRVMEATGEGEAQDRIKVAAALALFLAFVTLVLFFVASGLPNRFM